MKLSTFGLIAASGALLMGTQKAQAFPALLSLDNPLTPGVDVTVMDNAFGDLNPLPGVITFSGPVGSFIVNVSTGLTAPIAAGPYPHLDLNSINMAAGPGG